MKTFLEIVRDAVEQGAGAIYMMAGQPLTFKNRGIYQTQGEAFLTPEETEKLTKQAYDMARRSLSLLTENCDDQFALSISGLSRVRICAYRQRNSFAMTLRIIPFGIPDAAKLGIPEAVLKLADEEEGLVLVAGSAGSGKSTTLACLTDRINHSRSAYVLTVENPIEFLFRNDRSFVSQREVGLDVKSFESALGAAAVQAPDVLMVSQIPNYRSLNALLRVGNSRPLVLTAVTARNPSSALASLLALAPGDMKPAIAREISQMLRGIVCQKLEPGPDGNLVPEFKLLIPNERQRKAIAAQDLYLLE